MTEAFSFPPKRLVFTVTPGRSGTAYLNHLLQGLEGIDVAHEPAPHFLICQRKAMGDVQVGVKFLKNKKLPHIAKFEGHTYVETSHYCCRGFIEAFWELGLKPDLVVLLRDPRKIATSWYLISKNADKMREGDSHHVLSPLYPNLKLELPSPETLNDYQLFFWNVLEAQARARHYQALLKEKGGKSVEIWVERLRSGEDYEKILRWLDVDEETIARRLKREPLRKQQVNQRKAQKPQDRIAALEAMDLDALEAEVYERVEKIDWYRMPGA